VAGAADRVRLGSLDGGVLVDVYLVHLGEAWRDPEPPDVGQFRDPINQAKAEEAELRARIQFLALRETWSVFLIIWISSLLIFQIALTGLIGGGRLDFTKYQWFLPAVVAQNFGQVIGMGYIVVRFLYPMGSPAAAAKKK
jgi:hypothetical protein